MTFNKLGSVMSVLKGKKVAFARNSTSAINKQSQSTRQQVTKLGIIGDEQGDPNFHGGVEKAIHLYPSEHYKYWCAELGNKTIFQSVGAFGENISSVGVTESDICINGMFLSYACYFGIEEQRIQSVIDFILSQQMPDGGFNCRKNRSGAVHSSMHSTISLIEGIIEYKRNGYSYRLKELVKAANESVEFLLQHRLFRSDKTQQIIHKDFLKLSYPSRWRYDILRALDAFRFGKVGYDMRMAEALEYVASKRKKNGLWNLQAYYPG